MLLLDNNLSPKLALHLQNVFPGTLHVLELGLEASDDLSVWESASNKRLNIVTKDVDFVHILHMRGFPPKIIHINCGNAPTTHIRELLIREKEMIYMFLESPQHGLLMLY
jgi:predicted nuclease of predicted toxin-antitoxin system